MGEPIPDRLRQTGMPALTARAATVVIAVAVLAAVATGCGSNPAPPGAAGTVTPDSGRLTPATGTLHPGQEPLPATERRKAIAAARQEIAKVDATVTSASAYITSGVVTDSNTGSKCLSGRLLHIKLVGSFDHIAVSPIAIQSGTGTTSNTAVHAVLLTADATSGRTCQVSVQTGKVQAAPGATVLRIR